MHSSRFEWGLGEKHSTDDCDEEIFAQKYKERRYVRSVSFRAKSVSNTGGLIVRVAGIKTGRMPGFIGYCRLRFIGGRNGSELERHGSCIRCCLIHVRMHSRFPDNNESSSVLL